jgi:hypothetical protein
MASDGFTTVHVTTDPVEGELLLEVLRGEAIDARLFHVNSALLGATPHLFQIRLEVASESAARARELLDELGHPQLVDELSDPAAEDAATSVAPAPSRRALKLGVGLMLPGAAHHYVRQPWTAGMLQAGLVACFVVLGRQPESNVVANAFFASCFAIIAADILGAWRALVVSARGATVVPRARQLGRGVVLLALAGAVGTAVALAVALPRWLHERALEELSATCTDLDVRVTNHSARDRYLAVTAVTLRHDVPDAPSFAAEPWSRDMRRVAPGLELVAPFRVPSDVATSCAFGSAEYPSGCRLTFQVEVEEVSEVNGRVLKGRGSCRPGWSHDAVPPVRASPLRALEAEEDEENE